MKLSSYRTGFFAITVLLFARAVFAGVAVDFFMDPADRYCWQKYYVLDGAKYRLGNKLNINFYCKTKQGEQNPAVLSECARMSHIKNKYPASFNRYLKGRSLNPWENGWVEAASYAGISHKGLDNPPKPAPIAATAPSASAGDIFVNGVKYQGPPMIMPFLSLANSLLPQNERIKITSYTAGTAVKAEILVITSKEYPQAQADGKLLDGIKSLMQGLDVSVKETDAAHTPAGLGIDFLPFYAVKSSAETKKMFGNFISGGLFKEINGYLIYQDKSRQGVFTKGENKKNLLEVFTMAQCPYGVMALNALNRAVENKTLPKNADIRIRYIVSLDNTAGREKFSSMHGSLEWEEAARQLLIAKYYPSKLWKYIAERNKDVSSGLWQKSAEFAGIDVKKIENLFDTEGLALLKDDYLYCQKYGIKSSPTFLWEGKISAPGLEGLNKISGFGAVVADDAKSAPAGASCG